MDDEELTSIRIADAAREASARLCELAGGPDMGTARLWVAVQLYRYVRALHARLREDEPWE